MFESRTVASQRKQSLSHIKQHRTSLTDGIPVPRARLPQSPPKHSHVGNSVGLLFRYSSTPDLHCGSQTAITEVGAVRCSRKIMKPMTRTTLNPKPASPHLALSG